MKNNKLNEIRALYRAYMTATDGKEYIKHAYEEAVENYLTLYIINYAIDGNTIKKADGFYMDYYAYGKKLNNIRNYAMKRTNIRKLQDAIIVPF